MKRLTKENLRDLISKHARSSPLKLIIAGYCIVILLGSLLLWLPIASRSSEMLHYTDCLFTATSATCVTGLIRFDTYSTWTLFGQLVILMMIQIGGVGFMTLIIMARSLTRGKIGLSSRIMMQNSISAQQVGGIVATTRFIIKFTLLIEGAGALLLMFYFIPKFGLLTGIWYGIFHSISAFCNAGFDLFGKVEPGSSLTTVLGNPYVNIVIMLLIIVGGLGFFVWKDLMNQKWSFPKLRLQNKIVIVTSAILLLVGGIGFALLEQGNQVFEGMSLGEKILGCAFQSVTARTAGFNTMDLSAMTTASQFLFICLMFVGGSPGSTAGGFKTTTLAVQFLSVRSIFKGAKSVEVFKRSIEDSVIRTAACVTTLYFSLAITAALVISRLELVPFQDAFYEAASAIATVGVTVGITPSLGMISKFIIIALMIFGRSGSLTILLSFGADKKKIPAKHPVEKVVVG